DGDAEPGGWSPYFAFPLLAFVLVSMPHAWAYWMVPTADPNAPGRRDWWAVKSSGVIACVTACAAVFFYGSGAAAPPSPKVSVLATLCAAITVLILLSYLVLWLQWRRAKAIAAAGDGVALQQRVRNRLSARLANSLWWALPFLALAVLDSLGAQYRNWPAETSARISAAGGLWAGAIWLLRTLMKMAPRANARRAHMPLPLSAIAATAAFLLVAIALIAVAGIVHAVAWEALLFPGPVSPAGVCASAVVLFLVSAGASYSFGNAMRFLNDSSDHALYGARLARAYLGASNPTRLSGQSSAARRVTDPIAGDDFAMREYTPELQGGPLHLINITLNETVSGESMIEHRDR